MEYFTVSNNLRPNKENVQKLAKGRNFLPWLLLQIKWSHKVKSHSTKRHLFKKIERTFDQERIYFMMLIHHLTFDLSVVKSLGG